jgi:TolA-binding protein
MSDAGKLPEFEPDALRDQGTSARVERVWQRLDSELSQSQRRSPSALWWAPAAVFIIFGSGVFVGARWSGENVPPATALAPEPQASPEPGSAVDFPAPAASQPQTTPRRDRLRATPPTTSAGRALASNVLPEPVPVLSAQPPVLVATPQEWQRLANIAEYAAAWRALEGSSGFEPALERASAEQAMLLHDMARFTGQRGRAIQALRHVVTQHPGDPYAPMAAYTLGNMLDNAGDQAGAAEAFAVYRRLAPKGDFVEDALTRQLEVALSQRDVDLARRLADKYANEFPNGRRLGEIRTRVAQLTGTAERPAVGEPDGARAEDKPSEEGPQEEPATREPAP